ncbi:hypothetical protein [Psychrobacter phenylpyruvicus]|uniref:Uncharacterized protein n=1 Tax=Psychrobacter phenylpyruvicus TaxID=29432 RepID=A0A379LGS1_9GAMM|nr:hypothetical protein [Psychrobacter phenylpyruvicus]SUD89763.1 Uncharacterised protein [Psychrobacter phenylpyruvicus]
MSTRNKLKLHKVKIGLMLIMTSSLFLTACTVTGLVGTTTSL